MFIGNAQMDPADAEPPAGRLPGAVEHDAGPPRRFVDDAHVTETQFRADAGAQGLGNRLFSGESLGQEGRFVAPLTVFVHLRGAQNTSGEPIPMTLQGLGDANDGRQVRSHAENTAPHQGRAVRPLSNA